MEVIAMNENPSSTFDLQASRHLRYAANQTLFWPPMYMMDRLKTVGTLVFMEEAQYKKHNSRADIVTRQGPTREVLPLHKRSQRPLKEIEVEAPTKWASKFKRTLQMNYGKCSGYREVKGSIELMTDTLMELNDQRPLTVADVGRVTMIWSCTEVGIDLHYVSSEDLIGPRHSDASTWIAMMGEALKAKEYIGGGAAMAAYIKPEVFTKLGIRLVTQNYTPPEGYIAMSGMKTEQTGWLSVLDPLMVGGPQLVRDLIRY